MGTIIEFKHVTKRYGQGADPAVAGVSLTVEEGDFITILGTSGSGKTTLLKMVNGLIPVSEGTIEFQGTDISELDMTAYRRKIGYVIQQGGLFPHKTVAENIATVPRMLGWEKDAIGKRVDELLELMRLSPGRYAGMYPRMLSGGEQQRVGIARALAANPPVLLMDEPFGAIDAITREHLQNELCHIQAQLKKTILFVTHDIQEAFKMGDKVIVMHGGVMQQYATPYDIVFNPATDYVARLLKSGNFFDELKAIPVRSLMTPQVTCETGGASALDTDNLSDALEVMLLHELSAMPVRDQTGKVVGQIDLATVASRGRKLAS